VIKTFIDSIVTLVKQQAHKYSITVQDRRKHKETKKKAPRKRKYSEEFGRIEERSTDDEEEEDRDTDSASISTQSSNDSLGSISSLDTDEGLITRFDHSTFMHEQDSQRTSTTGTGPCFAFNRTQIPYQVLLSAQSIMLKEKDHQK
jgi:hypothetical protein